MDLAFTKRPSRFGHRYFLVIVDEFSHFFSVIPLARKSDVFAEFQKWHADMAAITGRRLRRITTDNGSEFANRRFRRFCIRNRVFHRRTVPHHSFQNGIAERAIRTLRLIATKIIHSSNVRLEFWNDVIAYAVFIHNRRPSLKLNLRTPIELFAPHLIESRKLFKFCSPIYFINPSDCKSDSNKRPGVFLGYPTCVKGYRVYDLTDRKTKIVHDLAAVNRFLPKDSDLASILSVYNNQHYQSNCKFNDMYSVSLADKSITSKPPSHPACTPKQTNAHHSPQLSSNSAPRNQQASLHHPASEPHRAASRTGSSPPVNAHTQKRAHNCRSPNQNNDESPSSSEPSLEQIAQQHPNRRITRGFVKSNRNPLNLFSADHPNEEHNIHVFTEPKQLDQELFLEDLNERLLPIDVDNDPQWRAAAFEEINALIRSGTVEYVKRPSDKQVLSSMLICTEKLNEHGQPFKKKVRVVAKGCQQKPNSVRRTFAPVAGKPIVRLAMAVANQLGYHQHHVDVKHAFLNSKIDEEVYVQPPKIFARPGYVWKLNNAIYGLKQSAHLWYEKIKEAVRGFGFKQSLREPCLFFTDEMFIILYVDDLLACGRELSLINDFKRKLASEFEIRDLGEVKLILGIKVDYDRERGILDLSQPTKITELLNDYRDQFRRRSTTCPLQKNVQKELKESLVSGNFVNDQQMSEYKSLLMRLYYLATTVRPDLLIYVNILSRCQRPTVEMHSALFKILSYLHKTADLKLRFSRSSEENSFEIYSDSSYFRSGESTIGLTHMFNGTCFDWVCFKSDHVVTSTNEAEFSSIYQASKSAIYYMDILKDFGVPQNPPIRIKNDNSGAVRCATRSVKFDSRDFAATELKTIERSRDGLIDVQYVNERENVADICTKFLDTNRFITCRESLGLVS